MGSTLRLRLPLLDSQPRFWFPSAPFVVISSKLLSKEVNLWNPCSHAASFRSGFGLMHAEQHTQRQSRSVARRRGNVTICKKTGIQVIWQQEAMR